MTQFIRLAPALLTMVCVSCSDSSGSRPPQSELVRIDLFPTAPEPRARDVVVARIVDWPTDPSEIEVEGAEVKVRTVASADTKPVLHVTKLAGDDKFQGQVTIRLKGQFNSAQFNRVVLSAETATEAWVTCNLLNQGVAFQGSRNRARLEPYESRSGPSKVVLELPGSTQLAGIYDELQLNFDNVAQPFRLGSIELCAQPIWAWLPSVEQGFGMVRMGSDGRNAVGLSTARTLEGEVLVPEHAQLRFATGIPQALRIGVVDPCVRVEIRCKGLAPASLSVPLESDPYTDAHWQSVRVPLGKFAGKKVLVSLSLSIANKPGEAVCAVTRPRLEIAQEAPRTVLLITSDTHRADSVGIMGLHDSMQTPTLDALARRGVLFEDCWSSTNVTLPSHAAILTATSPRDTGVLDNYARLSGDAYTLAEAFQSAGFLTFAVVSVPHLADVTSGLGQGFDRMNAPRDTNERLAAESIEKLTAWLADAEGQNLFVWLHLFDAHTPYEPPQEFERRYWPADRDAFDKSLPEPVVPPPYRMFLPEGLRDLELLSARYHGEVSYVDTQLAGLFEIPRIRSGVIAFTADHGESLGEHGIFWEHGGLYPQSIHVPLILAWPQAPSGTRVKQPVFQLDLAQTLLRLADVDDLRIPGTDLFAARDGIRTPRFTISAAAERASVTQDGWHLIGSMRSYLASDGALMKPVPAHHFELFDLATDPKCEHDLAAQQPARTRDLRRLLCAWLADARPRTWCEQGSRNQEMEAHLAQLGYAAPSGVSAIKRIDPACNCAECAPFVAH